jgi:hypothetical protein
VTADAHEPFLDDRGGVLGHVDEDAAGLLDGKGVEARGTAGYGDGEVEPKPALEALGLCGAPHNPSNGAHPIMWSARGKPLMLLAYDLRDST